MHLASRNSYVDFGGTAKGSNVAMYLPLSQTVSLVSAGNVPNLVSEIARFTYKKQALLSPNTQRLLSFVCIH
jgi:hypothetical protein